MARSRSDKGFDPTALVESAFLMGIGALEITKEKVGEFTDDLVERGKMSKSEAKKVGDRLGDMAKEQQDAVRKTVSKETKRAMSASGLATKKEVQSLRSEIAELKAMLADQKAASKPAARKAPARKAAPKKKS